MTEQSAHVLTPYGLQVEQTPEPLGIDARRPRFSWKLQSDRRGAGQSAYRLTAARSEADLDTGRLMWDSGRRLGSDALLVPWEGPVLQSRMRYHWRVEVWDEAQERGGSAQSWFETGLLHDDDWTAVWVARDPNLLPPVDPPQDHDRSTATHSLSPPLYVRRAFAIERAPVRARLYATARGIYEVRINGSRVGDQQLAPGWTEYHQRIQYQTYDVVDLLRSGGNALGAVVADGWWSGHVGFDPRRPAMHYGTDPAFLAQLEIEFDDGTHSRVATDGSWVEGPGEIQYSDHLMGEWVDARRYVAGWDDAERIEVDFRNVAVADTNPGPLVAQPDHPVRIVQEVAACSVRSKGVGHTIVDFGQNLTGRVRLELRDAAAGQRVVLRHAEMLDGGELYVDNLRRAESTDVYVAAGEAVEVFEPRFAIHGFRYVEVSNHPGELDERDITALVVRSDTPWTGEFECSNGMVNRLQANIAWSQSGNFVAVPTDCPQRDERLGWLADAQIFAATASRNADVSAFFARWLRDVLDGQDEDGAFRDVAPVVSIDREAAPAWGDGAVIIPWHLWRTYGDRDVLRRCLAPMTKWVDHIRRHNPDLIWRNRTGNSYGDWLEVDAHTPRDVLATAYFAHSTSITAKAAAVLGDTSVQRAHEELHAAIKAAFVDAFVASDGTVEGGTQTAYLLALGFDLLPEHLVAAAVDRLVADLSARGNRLTTGFVGVGLLCPVLSEHGHGDLAYALLETEEYPSWGYSIAHGATTTWERWDGWTEGSGFQSAAMNSFNHYSLGSVGDWFFGRIAGIDQTSDSVAYSEPLFRPLPGGSLTWARAAQETARGKVACGWSVSGREISVEVTVPPSCSAVLEIPTSEPHGVVEAGQPAGGREGVLGTAPHPDGLTLRLASGRYRFTAPALDLEPGTPASTSR
jgi:alpha-L-rhamnosidase